MNPQVHNRTLFTGDNLPILRGLDGDSVELIYLDPPFNSNKHYSAPVGSVAAGASFKDAWTLSDEDEAWHAALKSHHPKLYAIIHAAGAVGGKGDKSYLIYMAVRILELRRILKNIGSLYLHVDPTMSHSLKLVLDAVFGKARFRNEVIWCYQGRELSKKQYNRKHDVILFYSKSENAVFNWEEIGPTLAETSRKAMSRHVDDEGRAFVLRYKDGGGFAPIKNDKSDKTYRQYVPDKIPPRDWFIMDYSRKSERMGYPTQKPLALMDRIIRASSNEGDTVLDPFCGCATTCVAAEVLHRKWVGIDISPKALELVKIRLDKEVLGEGKVFSGKVIHRTDLPTRTDLPRIRLSRTAIKKILYGNQAGICNGCAIHFQIQNFEIDHIVPSSDGGAEVMENFQLLCGNCNRIKGVRTMEYLKSRLLELH